jgi:putative tricarboxylic transport membrane protein
MEAEKSKTTDTQTPGRVQWGHVAFVLGAVGFILWFTADAWRASPSFQNMMLVVPLAVISVLTGLSILLAMFLRWRQGPGDEVLPPIDLRIPGFMLLVSAYVVALLYIGFDLATFVFLLSCLWLLGERNHLVALIFSAALTAFAVFGLRELTSLPVPTILFPR